MVEVEMDVQVRTSWIILLICLIFSSGCTIARNNLTKANNSIADAEITHALAFQADPDFGKSLDTTEKAKLSAAERKALEYGADGEEIKWANQKETASGTVVSFRPFRVGNSNCRRFEHKLTLNGAISDLVGTACRKGEGHWKLIQ